MRGIGLRLGLGALGGALAMGCGDDGSGPDSGGATAGTSAGSSAATTVATTSTAGTTTAATGGPTTAGGSTGGAGPATCIECPGEPCTRSCLPALADGPTIPGPYSQGACPTLAAGVNTGFGFNGRDFELYVPTTTNGPFGVVFLWHGAGGSAAGIAPVLADRHDADGYILVVPDGQDRYDSQWHVEITPGVEGPPATDDLMFFDDVVTCLWEQFPIDLRRVHSTGFSVGARFSAYLMGHRSDAVGSVVTWSGGNVTPQGITVVPIPPHPIPGLLYHGGPGDMPACCGEAATQSLADAMVQNGQFTVVCNHDSGHTIPPPSGQTAQQTWEFMLAHPFSPGADAAWDVEGLPAALPAYCQAR